MEGICNFEKPGLSHHEKLVNPRLHSVISQDVILGPLLLKAPNIN